MSLEKCMIVSNKRLVADRERGRGGGGGGIEGSRSFSEDPLCFLESCHCLWSPPFYGKRVYWTWAFDANWRMRSSGARGLWTGSPAVKLNCFRKLKPKTLGGEEKKEKFNQLRLKPAVILIAEVCAGGNVRFRHSPLKLHVPVICWTSNNAQGIGNQWHGVKHDACVYISYPLIVSPPH